MLNYVSTRGEAPKVTASQAILNGIAPDGGLYVPEVWPALTLDWEKLKSQTYQEIATQIFDGFFDDFSVAEIDHIITKAYGNQWAQRDVVTYHQEDQITYMELFNGPTLAFKDVALQALPHLMTAAAKKQQITDTMVILTATSGDTGTAAMRGFGDVPQTEIVVFYPEVGVSEMQRQQMQTEAAKNAHVIAITGNFDDAQKAVKSLLSEKDLVADLAAHHQRFSSANSINIGRLVPQIVYYIHAYAQLVNQGQVQAGEPVTIVVPTGNFGNVLAAYYASQIGLPVRQFVVASNENHVLTDFFQTGRYDRKRAFKVTNAPAMDILVSSNLERLLYFASGRNTAEVKRYMQDLADKGAYEVTPETRRQLSQFMAGFATQEQVTKTIQAVFDQTQYTIDPHTAVGRFVLSEQAISGPTLLAATASPYKFADTVLTALGAQAETGYQGLAQLAQLTQTTIPTAVDTLFAQPILHRQVITPAQIEKTFRQELL